MITPRWCFRAVLLAASVSLSQAQSGPETQKLILENEFVRVFDIRLPPGVFEPKHSHAHGLTIALSDYKIWY